MKRLQLSRWVSVDVGQWVDQREATVAVSISRTLHRAYFQARVSEWNTLPLMQDLSVF